MVADNIEQLLRLIEHEAGLYECFLDCTLRQRQALIDSAEADIQMLSQEQDRLLRQISVTEKSSLAVMTGCADQLKLDASEVSIAALAQRLEEPHSQLMINAAHRLLETGTKVRSENLTNRHLINNHLELTDFCLRSIASSNPTAPAYRSDGIVHQQPQSLALDSRV
jgi:hypothetical protein